MSGRCVEMERQVGATSWVTVPAPFPPVPLKQIPDAAELIRVTLNGQLHDLRILEDHCRLCVRDAVGGGGEG